VMTHSFDTNDENIFNITIDVLIKHWFWSKNKDEEPPLLTISEQSNQLIRNFISLITSAVISCNFDNNLVHLLPWSCHHCWFFLLFSVICCQKFNIMWKGLSATHHWRLLTNHFPELALQRRTAETISCWITEFNWKESSRCEDNRRIFCF
jgi:hypothetical protein